MQRLKTRKPLCLQGFYKYSERDRKPPILALFPPTVKPQQILNFSNIYNGYKGFGTLKAIE